MKTIKIILITVTTLLIFSAIDIYFVFHYFHTLADQASFGDSFGSLNAIFSGLAFIGVIYTITQQRQELSLQKIQLDQQKIEFNISHITDITYKQIDRLDRIIDSSEFFVSGAQHVESVVGKNGIIQLDRKIQKLAQDIFMEHNIVIDSIANPYYKVAELIKYNLDDLVNIINAIEAGYRLIHEAVVNENFPTAVIDGIVNIYWSNVDHVFIDICRRVLLHYPLIKEKLPTYRNEELRALLSIRKALTTSHLFAALMITTDKDNATFDVY